MKGNNEKKHGKLKFLKKTKRKIIKLPVKLEVLKALELTIVELFTEFFFFVYWKEKIDGNLTSSI